VLRWTEKTLDGHKQTPVALSLHAAGHTRLNVHGGANYSPGVRHVWLNRHARSGLSGICIDCHD